MTILPMDYESARTKLAAQWVSLNWPYTKRPERQKAIVDRVNGCVEFDSEDIPVEATLAPQAAAA